MSFETVRGSENAVQFLLRANQEVLRTLQDDPAALDGLGLCVDYMDKSIEEEGVFFDLFVDVVEISPTLSVLILDNARFDHPIEAVDRLCGPVLSTLPSLRTLGFANCQLMPEYVELFAHSIAGREHGLRSLVIQSTTLGHQGMAAVANLLRANVQISTLLLSFCPIQSSGCQQIFEAMEGNTHLRELQLYHNDISSINLSAVQALLNSNLRTLTVNDRTLTPESILIWAEELRTNCSLEELHLHSSYNLQVPSDGFEEILKRFNYTLRVCRFSTSEESRERIDHLLWLNAHVRLAHENLEGLDYRLSQLSLYPQALSRLSSKPSFLYKFLRRNSLDSLVDNVNVST